MVVLAVLIDPLTSMDWSKTSMNRRALTPQESLVQININGQPLTQLLCSPVNLKELAAGWLLTQGIIDGLDDVSSLGVCEDEAEINVVLRDGYPPPDSEFHPVITSGCSGGRMDLRLYTLDEKPVASKLTVQATRLPGLLSAMFREHEARCPVRGMHCAALIAADDEGDMIVTRDVGRHNAVDKAIGIGLMNSLNFARTIVATSGRISSDMILKAWRAGIPIVLSPRSVTSMAEDFAQKAGIAVVGRLARPDRVMAGKTDRIVMP